MINYKLNNKNGHVNTNEFNIDERARYGTDIDKVHLIQLGKATNYYDDWRDHPNEYIRCALARRGYHSEYYLTDTVNVRNAALYHLPEKMINYVGDDTATTTITRYLIGEVDPDTDLLEAFIQNSSDQIASIYGAHVLDAFIHKNYYNLHRFEKTNKKSMTRDAPSQPWNVKLNISAIKSSTKVINLYQ